jgi:hypothetical protein
VRSRDCAFLNPFLPAYRPGLLRSAEGAFGRGLLQWQSEGDVLDRRLYYVAATTPPEQRQSQGQWERLWGSRGVHNLLTDADWVDEKGKPKSMSLDSDGWAMKLDRLEVSPIKAGTKDRVVGVRMTALGLKKK